MRDARRTATATTAMARRRVTGRRHGTLDETDWHNLMDCGPIVDTNHTDHQSTGRLIKVPQVSAVAR